MSGIRRIITGELSKKGKNSKGKKFVKQLNDAMSPKAILRKNAEKKPK